jgi:hypothetical protein
VSRQHHAPAAFTPGKEPVTIVQEAGCLYTMALIKEEINFAILKQVTKYE